MMRRWRSLLLPGCVVAGVCLLVAAATKERKFEPAAIVAVDEASLAPAVDAVNACFTADWQKRQLTPAGAASELQILRRLSLALHGTIPSLEEIRAFEADPHPARLARWTDRLLDDRRFADYFAERLARGLVGTDAGQFILFRRDRFVSWLSSQLQQRVPLDAIVRPMIADCGLWTGEPATNFITASIDNGNVDENKLAGRSVRAFLGQRIDCAQCHNHPFADWKQTEFEGLAAFFGQVRPSLVGIEDKGGEFTVEDRQTRQERAVPPAVPFHSEWLPATGSRRERFAAWVTHPENRRFERAVANRVWGLMFGRPYLAPVDDLPNPDESAPPDVLDLLGADFRSHGCDLRRLIRVIAATRPFGLDSAHPSEDEREVEALKANWAVFPLIRLRPEQFIGSILQATSVTTIDQNSQLFARAIRFLRERDFVTEYGDLGENELEDQTGTIPQALLRMNGKLTRELTDANPFSSISRIASMARDDRTCVSTIYQVCLTRPPTGAELEVFCRQFQETQGKPRAEIAEDLFWSIFNCDEFCWNH